MTLAGGDMVVGEMPEPVQSMPEVLEPERMDDALESVPDAAVDMMEMEIAGDQALSERSAAGKLEHDAALTVTSISTTSETAAEGTRVMKQGDDGVGTISPLTPESAAGSTLEVGVALVVTTSADSTDGRVAVVLQPTSTTALMPAAMGAAVGGSSDNLVEVELGTPVDNASTHVSTPRHIDRVSIPLGVATPGEMLLEAFLDYVETTSSPDTPGVSKRLAVGSPGSFKRRQPRFPQHTTTPVAPVRMNESAPDGMTPLDATTALTDGPNSPKMGPATPETWYQAGAQEGATGDGPLMPHECWGDLWHPVMGGVAANWQSS
eukprot:gene11789-13919_t